LGHELDGVLSRGHRGSEGGSCIAAHPRAQKLVDCDDDRIQNDELAPKPSHQRRSQIMTAIPAIRRGNDGPGIGQDPQSLETSSRS
jgi:hypothetical protein